MIHGVCFILLKSSTSRFSSVCVRACVLPDSDGGGGGGGGGAGGSSVAVLAASLAMERVVIRPLRRPWLLAVLRPRGVLCSFPSSSSPSHFSLSLLMSLHPTHKRALKHTPECVVNFHSYFWQISFVSKRTKGGNNRGCHVMCDVGFNDHHLYVCVIKVISRCN